MNAERLLAHFERISEAPDAIARLRRFILDLAVRGKLVEPPRSWLECSLGDVGDWGSGGTPLRTKPEYYGGDIPWLVIGDLNDGLVTASATTITEEGLSNSPAKVVDEGTLLIAMYGSIGKLGVAGMRCATNQAIAFCRPYSDIVTGDYLFILLKSLRNELLLQGQGVAQQNISQKILKAHPVELPALAEQHRIVAKVDELMALCDQLEAARNQREQGRERLVAATLQRLNQPSEDPASYRQDASFALQVLPSLTTTPAQIKQLRQTILNLAVRGKLVEQDPQDEPAGELLAWIAADRKLLSSAKSRNQSASIPPLPIEAQPYSLPCNWAWVRFGDIMYSRDGERVPVSKDERSRLAKKYDYYGASGVIDKIDGYLFDKPLLLIGEDGANLLNRSTPIAFIARGQYWVNNHAHVLDGISEEFLRFMELSINATDLSPYVTGTAQPKMNQAKMNSIPIALPPLAEQHRIVAKVDALMALCDQLEQQLSQADQQRRRLLEAVLAEALGGRLPTEEESHATVA